jgi:hypothetical protein
MMRPSRERPPDAEHSVRFRCLTGHEIHPDTLGELTERWTLDGGAVVQVCREHGTPIAVEREGRA